MNHQDSRGGLDDAAESAEEPDTEALDAATTGSLMGADVTLPLRIDEVAQELDKAELARRTQANAMRGRFFWFGVRTASLCVLTSAGVAVWLTATRQMTDAIGVAFITGLTVEVIGITAIIAKYLFPGENQRGGPSTRAPRNRARQDS